MAAYLLGAFRAGQALPLTAREFLTLECLVRAQGKAVTAAELRELLWCETVEPKDNIIAMLMMRLRKKVNNGDAVKLIHTRCGLGGVVLAPEA